MTHTRSSFFGSLPGTSSDEGARVIAGETSEAPILPLFPERGPGADSIGRTAGLLSEISSEFSVATVPSGWRITGTAGTDMHRARSFLSQDIDALAEHLEGFDGCVRVSLVGPVSWSARVDNARGEKLIRDHGAIIATSHALSESAQNLIQKVSRALPAARVWLHIDEPLIGAALDGTVSTASGLYTYVALDPALVSRTWKAMIDPIRSQVDFIGINTVRPPSDAHMSSESSHVPEEEILSDLRLPVSYQPTRFHRFAEILDTAQSTIWEYPLGADPRDYARDVAGRITSLGFDFMAVASKMIICPPQVATNHSWPMARKWIDCVNEAVDLLRDEDRLLS